MRLVTALAVSAIACTAHGAWLDFAALRQRISSNASATASPAGYRTETVTELRPVERIVERTEVRTVPRTITETVHQTVCELVSVPETRRVLQAESHVSYRPVYETVQEVRTQTVLKPVAVTEWREEPTTITRQIQETVWHEQPVWICQPVRQVCVRTVDHQVCVPVREVRHNGSIMTFQRVTETVCVEVCRIRPVAANRSCQSCVSEHRTLMLRGGILTGGCRSNCDAQSSTQQTCGSGAGRLVDGICDRWQEFGERLGDCGARLGCKIAHAGPVGQCLFIRVPDRIACKIVRCHEECCGQHTCGCRECQQSQPVRPCECVAERVPIKRHRYVAVHTPRTEIVDRLAYGAYVDRSALKDPTACVDGRLLGPDAASQVAAGVQTHETSGDGRVFVEGLKTRRFVSEAIVAYEMRCETRRVPETICRTVQESVVRKVPVTTIKMISEEHRTCVPKTVVRLERVECSRFVPCDQTVWTERHVPHKCTVSTTREICATEKVKVPFVITDLVPTTVTRQMPCTESGCVAANAGCSSRLTHAPGLLDGIRCRINPCGSGCGNLSAGRCTPVRDFLQRLLCRLKLQTGTGEYGSCTPVREFLQRLCCRLQCHAGIFGCLPCRPLACCPPPCRQ